MPLIKRKILPICLSRQPREWKFPAECGDEIAFQGEYDLTAVSNVSLCSALRQLSCILITAESIHKNLQDELSQMSKRATKLSGRLAALEGGVVAHNPKTVTVPESDMRSFSERSENFVSTSIFSSSLFSEDARPPEIRELYDNAADEPANTIGEIDGNGGNGEQSSENYICKPVFGDSLKKEKLRRLNLDIETRRPASFVALREWCSDDETFQSEVDLAPVSPSAPPGPPSTPHPSDQKLPLPEQRLIALSAKYPPKTVAIDVSGRGFRRMELFRQSLIQYEYGKAKRKRRRLRRRNTIADTREVRRSAVHIDKSLPSTSSGQGRSSPRSGSSSSRGAFFYVDHSFDTTIDSSSTKTGSEREVPPNLLLGLDASIPFPPRVSLCSSSRHLKNNCNSFRDGMMNGVGIVESDLHHSSPKEQRKKGRKKKELNISFDLAEDIPSGDGSSRSHPDKDPPSYDSHDPLSTTSESGELNVPPSGVKLREGNSRDEGTRSSSGNWSGSSSTRTSFESDSQHHQQQIDQQSTVEKAQVHQDTPVHQTTSPTSSFEQDSTLSESYQVRSSSPSSNLRSVSGATDEFLSSSSYASDGTLTPTQDIQDIPFLDDDTSSAFSCDAEGYYTSFHIDSGLRSVSYEGSKLASDSDCDAFARGSTGTTNSSASLKTVIMRNPDKKTPPKPPQRVSSLERKENRESIITVIHVNGSTSSREDVAGADIGERPSCQDGRENVSSKDGGSRKGTPSTQADQMCSRKAGAHPEKLERQELPAQPVEKKDSFKMKTTINASGIPSMCVITPPHSDDESIRSVEKVHNTHEVKPQKNSIQQTSTAKSRSLQTPPKGPGIRQPGDGEVAPSVTRSSPSFSTHSLGRQITPSLTLMSQKRETDHNSQNKNFVPVESQSVSSKSQPDQYNLGKSVLERRNEIQLKVLGVKKPSSDVLLQRQSSREHVQREEGSAGSEPEPSNLVSLKELPPMTISSQPFSAVPANVKQNVVITPTNSLERRKANSKPGAHVTLDSEGKVVYSSDSLPRKKVESSTFEPGPYIKPPPIATSSSVTQTKAKLGYSSIQNMPLPPVPGEIGPGSVTVAPPVASRTNTPTAASGQTHSTIASVPSLAPVVTKEQLASHSPSPATPQQPKLGTQSQISAISQTLSGFSSHMQPRTVSQINSIRYARVKDSKSLSSDSQPSSLEDSSQDPIKSQAPPHTEIKDAQTQAKINQRLQQQIKEQRELHQGEPNNSSQLVRNNSIQEKSNLKIEESNLHLVQQHQLAQQQQQQQQDAQHQRQLQQNKNQQVQLLQQIQHQAYQQQQLEQHKLQQQVLQHHKQQQHQLQQLQEQQQLQQLKEKQQIVEQQLQQKTLPKHPMPQASGEGQTSVTNEPIYGTKKDIQQLKSQDEALYQTRLDIHRQQLLQQSVGYQQAGYPQQQDLQMMKQQLIHHNQHQMFLQEQYMKQHKASESQAVGPTEVIVAAQGAPMSPHSQRAAAAAGAYIHVQSPMPPSVAQQSIQATQTTSLNQPEPPPYISRSQQQSSSTYHGGTTSRAPTPIQGLSTASPHHLPTIHSSATLPHNLRTHSGVVAAMMYGSERSLQSALSSSGMEGRGTPIPRPLSTSPPPYEQYNLTNSDIYGRIGMTRQVQVGGTLPAGFGRSQRAYSSLPPNLRHSASLQQHLPQQQIAAQLRSRQVSGAKTLTRRASVAGTETSHINASNNPEKALEKKERSSKKDKDKKKKDNKSEKPLKKKWFWTLPLRRKKKNKEGEATEDDDGGFKAASQKSVRKLTPQEDTSFIRYPSPDTGSSDLNSSYSSDLSSGEHGYRSSPSSEVYYYSQKGQQEALQHQHAVAIRTIAGGQPCQSINTNNSNAGAVPRSHPTTPVSPDAQMLMSAVPPSVALATEGSDITDLTRERRYMSRDAMYAAMRHPQYYNYNRNSIAGLPTDFSQNSTPSSSRSGSPAVFGINPLPPYTIKPQARDAYSLWQSDHLMAGQEATAVKEMTTQTYSSNSIQTNTTEEDKELTKDKFAFEEIEPPAGYGENISLSSSPTDSQEEFATMISTGTQSPVKPLAKQTTLTDFKKMILEKSMRAVGGSGRERVSAVEMLRASRPSIYGYSPPPLIVKAQEPLPTDSKGEGVIIPPNSRNTARALLFQSRFGSGRRFRTPKTEIISTTILEDKQKEEEEDFDDDSDDGSEETSSGSSPERDSVKCMRVPLAKASSEPSPRGSNSDPSDASTPINVNKKSAKVTHSTPIKPQCEAALEPLDLSIIVCTDEEETPEAASKGSEKEAAETSL